MIIHPYYRIQKAIFASFMYTWNTVHNSFNGFATFINDRMKVPLFMNIQNLSRFSAYFHNNTQQLTCNGGNSNSTPPNRSSISHVQHRERCSSYNGFQAGYIKIEWFTLYYSYLGIIVWDCVIWVYYGITWID